MGKPDGELTPIERLSTLLISTARSWIDCDEQEWSPGEIMAVFELAKLEMTFRFMEQSGFMQLTPPEITDVKKEVVEEDDEDEDGS